MRLISMSVKQISNDLYLEISVFEDHLTARGSTNQVSGVKTVAGRSSKGTILWEFTVSGTFLVNQGISAVCTSSLISYEIYDDHWNLNSGTGSTSGNQAIGNGEFVKKLLGIQVETRNCHVVLTCDANGNLS